MNLSENLKKLRKEKGLSQEQLAEKLNVTRQSVSKWESGAAYPEMDKIVELCKLFDLNMDDLVNKDINNKNYSPFKKILNYFEKIIKTFDSMSNSRKINCFIEQLLILIFVSILFSVLERSLFGDVDQITRILPNIIAGTISYILFTVYNIVKIILTLIIMFYIFKVRYMDNDKIKQEVNNDDEIKVNKGTSIIFTIFMFLFKLFILFMLLGLIMVAIGLAITLGLTVFIYTTGFLFIGMFLMILGFLLINLVFIGMSYNFLFDKKVFNSLSFITIVISVIMIGISSGIIGLSLQEFKVIDDIDSEYYMDRKYVIPMNDKQTFLASNSEITFVEKDISNIEVVIKSYKNCELMSFDDEEPKFYRNCQIDTPEILKSFLKDINNKKIVNYFKREMIVYANSENIIKLVNNRKHFGDYDYR